MEKYLKVDNNDDKLSKNDDNDCDKEDSSYDDDYDYEHILPDLARLMFELTPIDQHEAEIVAALHHLHLTQKNDNDNDKEDVKMIMMMKATKKTQQQQQNQQRLELLRIVWYEGWIEKKGPFKWVQRAPKIWDHSSWLVFLKEFFFVRLPLSSASSHE